MDSEVIYTRCIAIVGYIAIAFYIFLLIKTWRLSRTTGAASCISRLLQCRPIWFCALPRKAPDLARIEVEARNLATKQRLAFWKLMLKLFMHFSALCLIFFSYFRHLEGQIWSDKAVGQVPSEDPLIYCVTLLSAGMVVEFRRDMLKARFTDCFNATWMGLLLWKATATEDVFLLTFRSRGIAPMRFALAVWSGNTNLTFLLNMAYSLTCVWSYLQMAQESQQDAVDKFAAGHELWFAFDEVMMVFVVVAASYAIETRGLAESRATVKAHLAKQSEATVNSLLTCLCDAVVRLSPDFGILSGSAGLLSLLLKQPGSVHCILDAIDKTDHQRFQEYALSTHNIQSLDVRGPAPSLHVCMPDANGTYVDAQLFMASFPDLDNRHEYLLGIREISKEEGDMGRLSADTSIPSVVDSQTHPFPMRKTTSASMSMSDDTDNSGESVPWHAHIAKDCIRSDDVAETAVVLNLFTYNILEASPAFIGLGGPSTIGGDFLMWLLDAEDFKRRVQSAASQFMIEGENSRSELGIVKLQPPIAKQAKLEYRADCNLELLWCPGSTEDLDDDEMFFRVELANLSQRRSRSRNKKSRCAAAFAPKGSGRLSHISL